MDCERPSPLSLVVSVTSWVNLTDLSNISTAAGPEGAVSVRCSQNSTLIQADSRLGSDDDWRGSQQSRSRRDQVSENDSHTLRTVMRLRAPILSNFRRIVVLCA